ncbi:hypothetical protein V6R21_17980 [Limibacter armeniacum]|uniref:hypothetical protein n=1 Tax=Limibacter armeniacum TaxID=466084 RepID=UPI002FE54E3E
MNKFKKFLLITIAVLIAIGAIVFLFLYYGSYSSGYRSGVVMKMSKKGFIFKTYEGTLNMEGIDTYQKGGSLSSVWYFSVDRDQNDLLKKLEQASLKKQRVQLNYEEKLVKFFWRGDTRYFITDIEVLEENSPPKPNDSKKESEKTTVEL